LFWSIFDVLLSIWDSHHHYWPSTVKGNIEHKKADIAFMDVICDNLIFKNQPTIKDKKNYILFLKYIGILRKATQFYKQNQDLARTQQIQARGYKLSNCLPRPLLKFFARPGSTDTSVLHFLLDEIHEDKLFQTIKLLETARRKQVEVKEEPEDIINKENEIGNNLFQVDTAGDEETRANVINNTPKQSSAKKKSEVVDMEIDTNNNKKNEFNEEQATLWVDELPVEDEAIPPIDDNKETAKEKNENQVVTKLDEDDTPTKKRKLEVIASSDHEVPLSKRLKPKKQEEETKDKTLEIIPQTPSPLVKKTPKSKEKKIKEISILQTPTNTPTKKKSEEIERTTEMVLSTEPNELTTMTTTICTEEKATVAQKSPKLLIELLKENSNESILEAPNAKLNENIDNKATDIKSSPQTLEKLTVKTPKKTPYKRVLKIKPKKNVPTNSQENSNETTELTNTTGVSESTINTPNPKESDISHENQPIIEEDNKMFETPKTVKSTRKKNEIKHNCTPNSIKNGEFRTNTYTHGY